MVVPALVLFSYERDGLALGLGGVIIAECGLSPLPLTLTLVVVLPILLLLRGDAVFTELTICSN
jgi:hypothetical protein